jgi:hypothetical protein
MLAEVKALMSVSPEFSSRFDVALRLGGGMKRVRVQKPHSDISLSCEIVRILCTVASCR